MDTGRPLKHVDLVAGADRRPWRDPKMVKGWARKTALENLNAGKHVTIGSTVRCISGATRDHQFGGR